MTKQPHSATKLRLSKLFRWLAVLCFMKLTILGLLLLDVPVPSWLGGSPKDATVAVNAPRNGQERTETVAPVADAAPSGLAQSVSSTLSSMGSALDSVVDNIKDKTEKSQSDPQGSAAARMAAAVKPHADQTTSVTDAALPAPLIRTATSGGAPETAAASKAPGQTFSPNFPEPQALPAPQAEPGTSAPSGSLIVSARPNRASESEWLDALGLSNLPIPGLGSVQAAHAAALDMPVPQTPTGGQSPFAPAEQTAPLTIPGAPPIPANIPRGQGTDGAPLPPRGAAGNNDGFLPPLPQGQSSGTLPVPTVQQPQGAYSNDPNTKAQELARQQQDILVLRQQMDQRLKDIQETEKKMQDMIREAKGIENEKVHRLVLTYSMMKPKAAAKALESMDERVAIRILSGMSPKQSGEILTYVSPAKTAKLTELITRMRIPD
ncbi:hypothetical protein [uncultured Desulfovibrio sp.]|uniref:MotE family protein n=1 Tax=uncultured Desulfovibrio sp. TaxID=167968 RepID=UPI002606FB2C|nr:hypothetical protein [uncultured Desulfovibrio sp.]